MSDTHFALRCTKGERGEEERAYVVRDAMGRHSLAVILEHFLQDGLLELEEAVRRVREALGEGDGSPRHFS